MLPPPFSRWRRELRPSFTSEAMPSLVSRATGEPLGEDAGLRLCDRLAQGLAPRDIEAVRQACTPESLDRWLLAMLSAWEAAEGPSREAWVFRGLTALGGDAVVRTVGRRIERWARKRQVGWSVHGITVLASSASDLALLTLTRLAQAASDGRVRDEASSALDRVARARGVERRALEESAIPDLGLDARGVGTLDYGPRRFEVRIDERLRPFVEVEGSLRSTAPRVRAGDDVARAKEARALLKSWKAELAAIARTRIRMLEAAMRGEVRWSAPDFAAIWVAPTLVRPIARTVVFATEAGALFRVDDEGTLSDSRDDSFALPADASVGVAHPLGLDPEERGRWRERFADYELMSPFPQLDREIFTWPPESLHQSEEPCTCGWQVHPVRLRRLLDVGWREESWDGAVRALALPLREGVVARLELRNAYAAADLGRRDARVELAALVLEGKRLGFGDLSPVVRSELRRDLDGLRSGG